jgi:hypothetical protein
MTTVVSFMTDVALGVMSLDNNIFVFARGLDGSI